MNAADTALCRSALYEALALGLRPPTGETVARLAGVRVGGLTAAACALDPTLAPLVRAVAAHGRDLPALAAAHERLFGHTARGAVPAYETEYGADDLFRQPQELADLGGFYAAFGLTVAPGAAERADHVSVECEFMMFLARKEAVACELGDEAMLEASRRAERLFLRDHLGRIMPAFGERLRREAGESFHGALASLATAFVARECARLDVEPGAPTLRLRLPVEDAVPMACGTCPMGPGMDAGADGD